MAPAAASTRPVLRKLVDRTSTGAGWASVSGKSARNRRRLPGAGPAPAVDRLARVADRGDRVTPAEQRAQQHELGVAGVLVLVEQHDLVAAPLGRADLGVPGRDPGGDGHLVAVVDDLAGGLGPVEGGHQRQQLLAGPLAGDHLPGQRGHPAGQAGQALVQPAADAQHVLGGAQVLGQLSGQVDDGRGHGGRGPVHGVHRTVVGGHHARGDLPGHGRGDQPQRRLQAVAQGVVGDQAAGVGVVGGHGRLAGQLVVAGDGQARRGAARPAGPAPGRPARRRPSW